MTLDKMIELFDELEGKLSEFVDLPNKRANRPDLHAMLLLEELLPIKEPSGLRAVSAAEHDQIFLTYELEDLAKVITEEQIEELLTCGVFLHEDECLSMWI